MLKLGTLKDERAIGYNIARFMTEKNVTEDQLADMTNIPEMRIRAMITGSADFQEEELALIAGGLGVKEQELLNKVSDEALQNYNIHYMGLTASTENMDKVLDKVDMYVRLLNIQSAN